MRVAQRRRRSLPIGRIESELDTAVDMLELLYAHDHHRAVPVLRQENGTALDDIPLDVRVAVSKIRYRPDVHRHLLHDKILS